MCGTCRTWASEPINWWLTSVIMPVRLQRERSSRQGLVVVIVGTCILLACASCLTGSGGSAIRRRVPKTNRNRCANVVASARLAAVTIPGVLRIIQDAEEDGNLDPPEGGMNGDGRFCRVSYSMDISVDLENASHYDINDASQDSASGLKMNREVLVIGTLSSRTCMDVCIKMTSHTGKRAMALPNLYHVIQQCYPGEEDESADSDSDDSWNTH